MFSNAFRSKYPPELSSNELGEKYDMNSSSRSFSVLYDLKRFRLETKKNLVNNKYFVYSYTVMRNKRRTIFVGFLLKSLEESNLLSSGCVPIRDFTIL